MNIQSICSVMNANSVRKLLQAECDQIGLDALAKRIGVSPTHLHNVLVGVRKPRGRILDALNLELVEDYRPKHRAS